MENKTLARLRSPLLFYVYKFWKLPSLWFWGVKIVEATSGRCVIGLPFGWRTQNPFRSTYFSAQMGAAELSTGVLALAALDSQPAVSMLVVEARAEFFKKVAGFALFTCEDGEKVRAAVQKAVDTGEGQTVTLTSEARLREGGELVSRFSVTWSFKKKKG